MEKILLAIDALSVDVKAVDFACFLANLTHSKLTGVFLENLIYEDQRVLEESGATKYEDVFVYLPEIEKKKKQCEENIKIFKSACFNRGVNCQVHRDRGVPAEEIISESRFADIIIVDAETSFKKRFEGIPTKFMKEVLHDAECPVIISPERFERIDEIVFTYDGSSSSLFAIKQFTYLLPQLRDRKAIILHVNTGDEKIIEEKHKLLEWLRLHYNSFELAMLNGKPKDALFEYFLMKENIFIVMGAYGRSSSSFFLHHSSADLVLKTTSLPMFISHL